MYLLQRARERDGQPLVEEVTTAADNDRATQQQIAAEPLQHFSLFADEVSQEQNPEVSEALLTSGHLSLSQSAKQAWLYASANLVTNTVPWNAIQHS